MYQYVILTMLSQMVRFSLSLIPSIKTCSHCVRDFPEGQSEQCAQHWHLTLTVFTISCAFVSVYVLTPPMSYDWLCPNHSHLLLVTSSDESIYLNPSCVFVARGVLCFGVYPPEPYRAFILCPRFMDFVPVPCFSLCSLSILVYVVCRSPDARLFLDVEIASCFGFVCLPLIKSFNCTCIRLHPCLHDT